MEIIINGRDLNAIVRATQAAISASVNTPGLVRISAGNYGGRLGKSLVYLNPEKQPIIHGLTGWEPDRSLVTLD
ncbi:MAG: hypothetical protein ACHRXM_06100 [Isosphaerales bacterium]